MPAECSPGAPPRRRIAAFLFFLALAVYLLTTYAGIRSPDGEVVYEVAESLAREGSFEVSGGSDWAEFGTAKGRAGRRYSVFGPLQSVVAAPLVLASDAIRPERFFGREDVPLSQCVGHGLAHLMAGTPVDDPVPHARRALVALLNAFVVALSLPLILRICRLSGASEDAALVVALAAGFASLLWPYSGTFFSEPLATLFALVALERILAADSDPGGARPRLVAAGVALGLALAAHVTALLFVPFLGALAVLDGDRAARRRRFLALLAGFAGPVLLLGLSNAVRFGSPLETGRWVDPAVARQFGYGTLVSPGEGIHGLLFGWGKGLVFFCPAILLGIAFWPALRRRHPRLAAAIAFGSAMRLVVIASRSDWHGGYSLGPRLMVPIVPFLLLPIAAGVDELRRSRARIRLAAVVGLLALAAVQQLGFSVGEPFTWLHGRVQPALAAGVNPFERNALYLEREWSPLGELLDGRRGAFALGGIPLSNRTIVGIGALLLAAGAALLLRRILRGLPAAERPSPSR